MTRLNFKAVVKMFKLPSCVRFTMAIIIYIPRKWKWRKDTVTQSDNIKLNHKMPTLKNEHEKMIRLIRHFLPPPRPNWIFFDYHHTSLAPANWIKNLNFPGDDLREIIRKTQNGWKNPRVQILPQFICKRFVLNEND